MKKFFRNTSGKVAESILFLSSTSTSLIIILIVIFLFKEGISLFNEKPVEEGNILVVNKSNPVNELKSSTVKDIFDQNITNWESVTHKKDSIILVRIDDVFNYYTEEEIGSNFENLSTCISDLVAKTPGIIAFIPEKFFNKQSQGKIIKVRKVSIRDFFSGKEWMPTAHPAAQLGILPLLLGTLLVSLGAIIIALPFGLASAIYLAEITDESKRRVIKPLIELLAGIPSVVYGFFGLVVIVPFIQNLFNLSVGETALSGSIVLAIMALPTIITISEDALRTTPRSLKEASLSLGASKWQTIYRVVIPYAKSGITAGIILGIGRAIGETMAVLMVTGNAAVIPHTFLEPVRTIPATIAAELGEAPQGGLHFKALFALGCILFIITLLINLSVQMSANRKTLKK